MRGRTALQRQEPDPDFDPKSLRPGNFNFQYEAWKSAVEKANCAHSIEVSRRLTRTFYRIDNRTLVENYHIENFFKTSTSYDVQEVSFNSIGEANRICQEFEGVQVVENPYCDEDEPWYSVWFDDWDKALKYLYASYEFTLEFE